MRTPLPRGAASSSRSSSRAAGVSSDDCRCGCCGCCAAPPMAPARSCPLIVSCSSSILRVTARCCACSTTISASTALRSTCDEKEVATTTLPSLAKLSLLFRRCAALRSSKYDRRAASSSASRLAASSFFLRRRASMTTSRLLPGPPLSASSAPGGGLDVTSGEEPSERAERAPPLPCDRSDNAPPPPLPCERSLSEPLLAPRCRRRSRCAATCSSSDTAGASSCGMMRMRSRAWRCAGGANGADGGCRGGQIALGLDAGTWCATLLPASLRSTKCRRGGIPAAAAAARSAAFGRGPAGAGAAPMRLRALKT
mmetsp:Transcript_8899/g.27637  ORF Transcript_8899/g.27637 Transcript_8899/m.27637 type:complete len:312 (-) Transcript_8899:1231-2166(-)